MNDWTKSKKAVMQLPNDYLKIHREYEQNEPGKVKVTQSGKYKRIQVNLPRIKGFELLLLVYIAKESGLKASYILFNDRESVVFERNLLNEHIKSNHTTREDWLASFYDKKK